MKINIIWTLSKVLAFLILLSGWVGAVYFNDGEILVQSFIYSGVVMGANQAKKAFTRSKNNHEQTESEAL